MKVWYVVPPLVVAVFFAPWVLLTPRRVVPVEPMSQEAASAQIAGVGEVIQANGEILRASEGMALDAGDQVTLRPSPEANVVREGNAIRLDRPMILQQCDSGLCAGRAPVVPVSNSRYFSTPEAQPSIAALHESNSSLAASIVREANAPGQTVPEPILAPVHSFAPPFPNTPQPGATEFVASPVTAPHQVIPIGLPSTGSVR